MKQNTNLFNLAVLAVLVMLALGAWRSQTPATVQAQAPQAAYPTCDTGRTVQVSGAAVVNVSPDRVLLQLGVQTNGTTPDEVRSTNQAEIQKVINALRGLGIEAKDIASDYYLVYPVYDNYNSLFIKGYRIDNTVSVTLRDVNLVDDAIIAALKVGANEVLDVSFYTSELRKFRDQARDLAMKAAGEKAQALAEAASAQTGCVVSISENTSTHYYGSWRGGRETTLWAQNTIQNASPVEGQTTTLDDSPISLGQIAVRAEVSVSYSLK